MTYENAEALAKTGTRAPASAGEVEQRIANKAHHSNRVFHGGRSASGSKRPSPDVRPAAQLDGSVGGAGVKSGAATGGKR